MQNGVLEFEIHVECDLATFFRVGEMPIRFHIAKWPVEIFGHDPLLAWPQLNPRAESLAKDLERNDQIGRHHLVIAVILARIDAGGGTPWQKLGIAGDVGDQIVHLLRGIRQGAGFGMAWHLIPFDAFTWVSHVVW